MQHVRDLKNLLQFFAGSNFYSVSVQEYKGSNCLSFEIDKSGFNMINAALLIGDALHNLKSALDILYFQTFNAATGMADHRTRFPIRNEREELIVGIDGGLKKKGLTDHSSAVQIFDLLLDIVKPYQAGNYPLWALHELNILDKHQLLIPVFDMMRVTEICFEDDKNNSFVDERAFIMDESCHHIKLGRKGKFTVKDKGNASTAILFNVGIPYENQSVIQALHEMSESVTRTIDAFGLLPSDWFIE